MGTLRRSKQRTDAFLLARPAGSLSNFKESSKRACSQANKSMNNLSHTKFRENPKSGGINSMLEIVYWGLVLIRATTLKTFSQSKNLQYGTLLNLLNNYMPI